ncbi:MAG TPA: TSUP family transporter [Puia sp.]|nr:TSUP family transporter [Puia sp.]
MKEKEIPGDLSAAAESGQTDRNSLFPVFLKLEELDVLLVGGGKVGLEKLSAILSNAPRTAVTVVATTISPAMRALAEENPSIHLYERPFEPEDLEDKDIVVVAVNDKTVSNYVRVLAKARKLLVNVADTPELCDFYLGSIVEKGNLKIAISTNGKSPTIAKRIKEQLNEFIPDQIESVLQNMHVIRQDLKGDFAEKVKQLDDLTKVISAKQEKLEQTDKPEAKKWPSVVKWCLFAFVFILVGYGLPWAVPYRRIPELFKELPKYIDLPVFFMMLLTGFLAQMVDGSLGMGYGTISTTFLLANGISPAIVSSRVHAARTFSSGISGYSHHRFGNINKKLFRTLVIPGVIGAIIGASLAFFGQRYSVYVRVPLSLYTLYLGYYIIRKAFRKRTGSNKVKKAGWLAAAGGFMDAFAGGGWGSLVTGTLISKRRNPRYVIGSVCLAEFFVVFASSITFFILLKTIFLIDVAGLILGGLIAAPIAARLVGKIPMKVMFIAVGSVVILTSLMTLIKGVQNALLSF